MSIRTILFDKVQKGMLFPLLPSRPGDSPRRLMFVSEDLWNVIISPQGDEEWERRVGVLRATLERFVDGQAIDPKYLFRLVPINEGIWEIRCTRENPSIRVIGFFAAKDVFVATNHALRPDLGGWESRAWRDAKVRAATEWRSLFHTYEPMLEISIHSLVSGAVDGKYFK